MSITFESLKLNPAICKTLQSIGYEHPTPVQAQSIPIALTGKDLIVCSKTGSGKTAAFMLPALHRLVEHAEKKDNFDHSTSQQTATQKPDRGHRNDKRHASVKAQPYIVVLTPTRELALQVTTAVTEYGQNLKDIRCVAILGGMPYPKQLQLLAKNPQILVATPGRLIDHIRSGKIDLSQVGIWILDEADRMLDMGFSEDIDLLAKAMPTERQTLLFSATVDGATGNIAKKMTRQAEYVHVATPVEQKANIDQKLYFVDDVQHKNRLLNHLLADAAIGQAIIFTSTKRDADQLAFRLSNDGFSAAALHGDMHQGARNRTLNSLRCGSIQILVATDVASRGIDVPGISHVFNFDLPKFAEDYVHRIGRTGRAGRSGLAISLVQHNESNQLRKIERFTQNRIEIDTIAGFEPVRKNAVPKKTTRHQPSSNKRFSRSNEQVRSGRTEGVKKQGSHRTWSQSR